MSTNLVAVMASFEQVHLVGVGTTFLLPSQPMPGSALVFLNGLFLTSGVDYALSGATLTLIHKVLTGADTLTAYYLH